MSDSEAVARDEFLDSLLGDFLDESEQLLDRLNENLLQLDEWVRCLDEDHTEPYDDELMNEMFRSAHNLKGLSAMLGLDDINNLTDKVENVFDAARKQELIITGDCVELMFQAVGRLVGLVDVLKDPDAGPVECGPVVKNIQRLLQSAGVERKQTTQEDAERALQDSMGEVETAPVESKAVPAGTEETQPQPQSETASEELQEPPAALDEPATAPETETAPVIDYFGGLEDETGVPAKYLSIFIDETELSLDDLTETLLALEGGGSREDISRLLVTSHRIKGSAASVGLNRAAKLAHLMEDLLQTLVDTCGTLSVQVTDAMLACTDGLRLYVDGLKRGKSESDHFSDLARGLLVAQDAGQVPVAPEPSEEPTAASGKVPSAPPPSPSSDAVEISISDELRTMVTVTAPEGATVFVGVLKFRPKLPLVGLKARLVYEKLANLGEVCYFDPPVEQTDEIEELDGLCFGVATEKSLRVVRRQLRIAGVRAAIVEPLSAEALETADVPDNLTASGATPAMSGAALTAGQAGRPADPSGAGTAGQAGKATAPAPAATQERGHVPDSSKPTETLRVDIDRLDQLMNLAGQLVINKARVLQIGDSLRNVLGSKQAVRLLNNVFNTLEKMASGDNNSQSDKTQLQTELKGVRIQARRLQNDLESVRREVDALTSVRSSVNDLEEAIHQLDRVTDRIQQSVMDTRMVPIGPLFGRFKRVVRDITRTNGKSIRLVISGEKTELDKRMIDELGDPLIHMVRNSADHGIELPEDRKAAGKPREGTISLDAFHRGNSIFIEVTDDGKGLDPDRILRKALDKGMVAEADAKRMTRHQIYQLVWEPGLTTAEKVTEVSGRGMGMDIVRSKIEDLSGTFDLDSTPGKETKVTIKLPLTLAILPCLMVEFDADVFAMPMESVIEIVSIGNEDLATVHGLWTARVRGRVISIVKLNEIFAWKQGYSRGGDQAGEETTLVIVGEPGHEIGLAVDRVLGEEDVVIKSMAENYRNVPGIAGASILGDGRISLILDVIALISMASNQDVAIGVS